MREPASSATRRIEVHGTRLNRVTLSTGPREAMAMFGHHRVTAGAEKFDDGDERHVELPLGQQIGEAARHVEDQFERAARVVPGRR